MLAYFIPTENRYVRTQGEAKKLGFGEATDIPTDKDGLLEFVNKLVNGKYDDTAVPSDVGFVRVVDEHGKVFHGKVPDAVRHLTGDSAYLDDAPPMSAYAIEASVVEQDTSLADTYAAELTEKRSFLRILANSLSPDQADAIERDQPGILKAVGYVRPKGDMPMDAAAVLTRMDNPGLDIDAIIEKIAKMKGGYALKRVAGAVAIRFEELSK